MFYRGWYSTNGIGLVTLPVSESIEHTVHRVKDRLNAGCPTGGVDMYKANDQGGRDHVATLAIDPSEAGGFDENLIIHSPIGD